MYKVSFVCKLLWKTTFVNFIPASQILSSHLKNYFLFWIEIPVSGFLAALPLECSQPLLLDGSLIKPHRISDPSSTKACSKACYFSAEALLAACCLSTRAGLPWQLSQLSPAALPGALHTQSCSALTTGFLLHWGLPKLKAVSACGSLSHPLPPNPDVHRHLLFPFPYDRSKGFMVNTQGWTEHKEDGASAEQGWTQMLLALTTTTIQNSFVF